MAEHDDEQAPGTPYARRVGERLRAIRRQKRLSLQEVEARSTQEFKASVLGAYERGERAISVPRLQRLAKFYNVPVDQLLPHDEGPDFLGSLEESSGLNQHLAIAGVEAAGPHLAVRLLQHLRQHRRCNSMRGHARGVERDQDPPRLAAEDLHIGDVGHALELIRCFSGDASQGEVVVP